MEQMESRNHPSPIKTNSPFPPGSSVAAYIRDSGGDEQDLSTIQQELEIRTWCESHQVHLTRIFLDEAQSGASTTCRTAFLEMVAYFSQKNQTEQGVIVWKFSRISREFDDAQFYKSTMRRNGYTIHSLNEIVPEGVDGRLFEAALDWMNARYLKDMKEDVKRALHHNVKAYGALGGSPPRGFKHGEYIEIGKRRNGKPHRVRKWVPDEDLIPVVRKAFTMRANGASYKELTETTQLYKSKSGWLHFFENEIYIGILHFGAEIIEDYCEPIIDGDLWQMVQDINQAEKENSAMRKSAVISAAQNSDYLLTGLLQCAKCGSNMSGWTIPKKNNEGNWRYYHCTLKRRSHGKECNATYIPKEYIEMLVLKHVSEHILDITNLINLRDEIASSRIADVDDKRADLSMMQKRMAIVNRDLGNLVDSLAQMGHSPTVQSRIHELEKEKLALQDKIYNTELDLITVSHLPNDEELQNLARKMRPYLENPDNRQKVKEILKVLIHHIEAHRDKRNLYVEIFYYMPKEEKENYVARPHSLGGTLFRHSFEEKIPTRF
jgi:DNA invertase Pin-like site-specific DNA recombinase